ncbi:MAG: selenide, water dikinase SelD [Acidobacteriaceae bacterium]
MASPAAVRLTQQVKAGGCASKLAPGSLQAVLAKLPRQTDENLLVGFDTSDDAGVYRIGPDLALVQTVDFFTPLVDDPYIFGRIAAANALSDIYAMGGRALTALTLACFPQQDDLDTLEQIMQGGLSMMREAGCVVVGGHSVKDPEIKFGYAVSGLIDPKRIYTNTGARPGDVLILTKPIGTGVITTALKQGKAEQSWVGRAIESMTTLNRAASLVATREEFEVHAMTDVTGFGLMGHGRELAMGSGVSLEIEVNAVPLIDGARDAVRMGTIPAGLLANREFAGCFVCEREGAEIAEDLVTLMYDPQTSGGLLIAVAEEDAEPLLHALHGERIAASRIGRVGDRKAMIELR